MHLSHLLAYPTDLHVAHFFSHINVRQALNTSGRQCKSLIKATSSSATAGQVKYHACNTLSDRHTFCSMLPACPSSPWMHQPPHNLTYISQKSKQMEYLVQCDTYCSHNILFCKHPAAVWRYKGPNRPPQELKNKHKPGKPLVLSLLTEIVRTIPDQLESA